MGAVQFVLKGDKDEKKILSYNEKQRIYKEQSQILMSNFINDKGYLKLNPKHKSKFTHYNYSENIIVYKDLYKNISYMPITKDNSIVFSKRVPKEEYYKSNSDISHIIICGYVSVESLISFCQELFHKDHGSSEKNVIILDKEMILGE